MRSAAAAAAFPILICCCIGFIACRASSFCPSGQFMLKGQCVLCHPTCSECDGHELFECTTCGVDEDGQEHFLHQGRCRTHCPRGLYPDRGHYVCMPCIANCELCTDGYICAKCREHYKLKNGVCQTASCDTGQVQDPDTGECIDCAMGCKTCSTENPEICNSCGEGYFLFRHQCRRHCPQGTYEDGGRGVCLFCPAPCTDCRSDTSCLACQPDYFLNGGECIKQCPQQTYSDSTGWHCQPCHSSCLTCLGPRSTDCELCLGGNPSLHGQCPLVNCPPGQYFDDGTCRRCPPHCDACSDDGACYKCSFLYLMLNGVCKASCPVGYYEDMEEGRCGQCHPTCATCAGPLADDCETCSTFSPKLYKGACFKDCVIGTYYEPEAMECQECHQTCTTCSGSDANQCTQCEKGLVLDPNTLMCGVTSDTDCPPGTYLHDDQFTCMGCYRHCYSCDGPGNNECNTCVVPNYLHNSTCVSECPDGTYKSRQDVDGKELGLCLPCNHVCSTCDGASQRDCQSCSPGHLRLLHLCVTHCPTGYFKEGSHCEKCDQSCEGCTGPGPDYCRACPPPLLELQGTKLCVQHCPQRFYLHNDGCQQCHTSCETCTEASPQSCLTCDRGSILKDKVCYPRCEEGRYFSSEETCEPCDDSCRHCTGPRPDQCITCHPDSALHAVENRCARCCQAAVNDTDCCVCDGRSALCVEAPQPKSGVGQGMDLNMSSRGVNHTPAALPISLLLALGLALAVFALVKAHARKRLCWGQSYERLSGSASINMPHGVPEPDSGDEADVVYTSRGGSVYRRYSFIHEQDNEADQDADESTCLNQS
uniref:proprotein convertase subtilisin/kexin type 5 isoform X2 n=1 Tax=Solea senegalensis TaxID=28829 RepID=UPI001CD85BC9|nr:proprotein convertase subtilisin/kexin type 5 isoform X2 [Solea senegalensis]